MRNSSSKTNAFMRSRNATPATRRSFTVPLPRTVAIELQRGQEEHDEAQEALGGAWRQCDLGGIVRRSCRCQPGDGVHARQRLQRGGRQLAELPWRLYQDDKGLRFRVSVGQRGILRRRRRHAHRHLVIVRSVLGQHRHWSWWAGGGSGSDTRPAVPDVVRWLLRDEYLVVP